MINRENGLSGYNTWASSLPKDYLAKFALMGGRSQVAVIDDVLPLAYLDRSKASEQRLASLYNRYLTQIQKTVGFGDSARVVKLSDYTDLADFARFTGGLHLNVRATFPKPKRDQYPDVPIVDFFHPYSEMYAYRIMEQMGIQTILRGSGQKGLVGEYLKHFDKVQFKYIPKNQSTEQIGAKLGYSGPAIADLMTLINNWKEAGLLKDLDGTSSDKVYGDSLPSIVKDHLGLADTSVIASMNQTQRKPTPEFVICADTPNLQSLDIQKGILSDFQTGRIPIINITTPDSTISFVQPDFLFQCYSSGQGRQFEYKAHSSEGGASGENKQPSVTPLHLVNEHGEAVLRNEVASVLSGSFLGDNAFCRGAKIYTFNKLVQSYTESDLRQMLGRFSSLRQGRSSSFDLLSRVAA